MDKLSELNAASEEQAICLLEPFIERAPEIAKRVASHRPGFISLLCDRTNPRARAGHTGI